MTRKILAASLTCAALLTSSAAYAAFAPSQTDYNFESKVVRSGSSEDAYYRLAFTVPGVGLPTSLYCSMVTATWVGSQPVARSKVAAGNRGVSKDGTSCEITVPKDMKAGSYQINLSYQGNSQSYKFNFTDNEPIEHYFYRDHTQITSPDFMSGDAMQFTFFRYYGRLKVENLPEGLKVAYGENSDSLIINGRITTTESISHTFNVVDEESGVKQAVTLSVRAPDPEPGSENPTDPGTTPVEASVKFIFRTPYTRVR